MTQFKQILQNTLKHEGFYSNVKQDKGGETYRGIARNYFPNWEGWNIVDKNKPLKHNQKINDPKLDKLIIDFYKKEFWDKTALKNVADNNFQSLIFDIWVNSRYKGIREVVQDTLNTYFSQNLLLDGIFGRKSAESLNNVLKMLNPEKVFNFFVEQRVQYYKKLVSKNISQQIFLKGWLNRAYSFKYKVSK